MPGLSWLLNNSRSSEGVGAHFQNQNVLFGSFKSNKNSVPLFSFQDEKAIGMFFSTPNMSVQYISAEAPTATVQLVGVFCFLQRYNVPVKVI